MNHNIEYIQRREDIDVRYDICHIRDNQFRNSIFIHC